MKKFISVIFLSALTGCSSIGAIKEGTTIDDFIENMNGKNLGLLLKREDEGVLFQSQSGKFDKDYGLVGIKVAFEPASQYCAKEDGILVAEDKKMFSKFSLPTKITCYKNATPIWSILPNYSNYRVLFVEFSGVNVFYLTLNPVKSGPEAYTAGKGSQKGKQLTQVSKLKTRNNNYGDMTILNYCFDYPTPVYQGCRGFAEKVRKDESYEWKLFQSLNLSMSQKKAREESKKYNGSELVSDRELLGLAKKMILPNFKDSLAAGPMDMNAYFCTSGINNYKYGVVLDTDHLYKDCLKQLEFTKSGV